jgi:hypothetical protein
MSIFLPRGLGKYGLRRAPQDTGLRQYRQLQIGTGIASYLAVTSGSTAHTAGSWVQASSSLASNAGLLCINFGNINSNSVDSSAMLDVATGASGAESVIVPTIAIGGSSNNIAYIPVSIPAGSRVAVRVRGARTSVTFYPQVWFFQTGDFATTPRTLDILGVDTSTSKGTAMSGASGSYAQITSSTSKDYQQIVMVASSATSTGASASVTYTLAYGAAGSEVDQGSIFASYSGNSVSINSGLPLPLASGSPVPAGTRLSVKHNIASNPQLYSVCLLGVPYV